jgi:MoaA/NifB/PqqE/SkfB family radical SAM enzyme
MTRPTSFTQAIVAQYHHVVEPKKQIEVQLGHMCNNRCVFCVSGQQTARGHAGPLDLAPHRAELAKARADGHEKLTLLGGEPTIQPGFLDLVRYAVSLGFAEIVIFTNGVKTARASFIDEILALARAHPGPLREGHGLFTWRISIQGGTEQAHEVTTRKDGSFARILRTMEHLKARGERVTVNMCVVRSNYASVVAFPELCARFGVTQLHLDMVRPKDAGVRTDEEIRAMIPRYSDMVPALTAMIDAFPEGFDVNIGNLPFCVAPHLTRFIHHDGEQTLTVAVDDDTELSAPWDKYADKRRDKGKPASCDACAVTSRCNGVFDAYRALHGTDELMPISEDRLRAVDPAARLAPPLPAVRVARTVGARLVRLRSLAPFGELRWREVIVSEAGDRAELVLDGPSGERATVWLTETAGRPAGGYRIDAGTATPALVEGLRAVMDALRVRPGLLASSP